jgi:hypothetical protein
LEDKAEDIYVIDITVGKTVVIEAMEMVREVAGRVLRIETGGITVSLLEGAGMTQRPLSTQEAAQLVKDSTPQAASDRRPVELSKSLRSITQEAADTVQEAVAKKVTQTILTETLGGAGRPSGFEGPTQPPPSGVTPTEPVPPVLIDQGGGPGDWYWGAWDDGSARAYGNFLTSTDFKDITDSHVAYDLITRPGTGQAGAWLANGAGRKWVNGPCDLNVQINVSVNPQWSGAFHLSNKGGDFLNFSVSLGNGVIDASGNLHLAAWSGTRTTGYSMQVNGAGYGPGSITAEGVSGRLVKPTGGSSISGASGTFYFQHGSAARVDGAFGSDLQAR